MEMFSSTTIFFALILFSPLASSWPAIFDGKGDASTSTTPLFNNCVSQYPSEADFCYQILDCIMGGVEPAIAQRWSAGASVLAFIPTILALTSNSIEEITVLAEDSSFLAILLCLSSLTAFSSRLNPRPHKDFRNRRESLEVSAQRLWDHIENAVYRNSITGKPWWQNRYLHIFGFGFILLGSSAYVWLWVLDVLMYGVIVFACRIKLNIGLWAATTQLLGIVSVLFRRQMSDIRKIQCTKHERSRVDSAVFDISRTAYVIAASPLQFLEQPLNPRPGAGFKLQTTLNQGHFRDIVVVLRSERNTWTRWALEISTEIINYGLFTYGTVLFASTTFVVVSKAIRFMVTAALSAGFGRLVVSLLGSTSASGKRMILADVPADQLVKLSDVVRETIKNIPE